MRATRALFLTITAIAWALNGLALAQIIGFLPSQPDMLVSTLLINIVLIPLLLWAGYRTGELAEEVYRSNEHERVAAAAVSANANRETAAAAAGAQSKAEGSEPGAEPQQTPGATPDAAEIDLPKAHTPQT